MTKGDIYAHLTDIIRQELDHGGVRVNVPYLARRLRQLADRVADDLRSERGLPPVDREAERP